MKKIKFNFASEILTGVLFLGVLIVAIWAFQNTSDEKRTSKAFDTLLQLPVTERVKVNYGYEIEKHSRERNLPSAYFKALAVLECSGNKPSGTRFEKHVFNKLKKVRDRGWGKFENIKAKDLADASDEALKNLATSWGPFQLMGYKCVLLGIKVEDIRGNEAVKYGIEWADLTYGKYLRKNQFEDAFHMHNAGRRYPKVGLPKTHDPLYVSKGIKQMASFK